MGLEADELPQNLDYVTWTTDHGLRTMDYGLRTMDYGPRTTDYRLLITNLVITGIWVVGTGGDCNLNK